MTPARGDVWLLDLDPTIGHEQAGRRPGLVVSVDALNQSAAELVIVVPITSRERGIQSHVEIPRGEGGLRLRSFAKCEDLRSVSKIRLSRRLGTVGPETLEQVGHVLAILLDIRGAY